MRALLSLAILAAFVAGCASPADPTPAAPAPTPSTPEASPATPSAPSTPLPEAPPVPPIEPPTFPEGPYDLRTTIAGGAFAEPRLEAGRLVTVTWTNADTATHSVVSDDGQFAGSGPIPPGGEFARTFITAGKFPFSCRYHGNMAGVLIVH